MVAGTNFQCLLIQFCETTTGLQKCTNASFHWLYLFLVITTSTWDSTARGELLMELDQELGTATGI
eukprot:scaffold869_cov150-Cylindrotheca_fusiformis.AAC.7